MKWALVTTLVLLPAAFAGPPTTDAIAAAAYYPGVYRPAPPASGVRDADAVDINSATTPNVDDVLDIVATRRLGSPSPPASLFFSGVPLSPPVPLSLSCCSLKNFRQFALRWP